MTLSEELARILPERRVTRAPQDLAEEIVPARERAEARECQAATVPPVGDED